MAPSHGRLFGRKAGRVSAATQSSTRSAQSGRRMKPARVITLAGGVALLSMGAVGVSQAAPIGVGLEFANPYASPFGGGGINYSNVNVAAQSTNYGGGYGGYGNGFGGYGYGGGYGGYGGYGYGNGFGGYGGYGNGFGGYGNGFGGGGAAAAAVATPGGGAAAVATAANPSPMNMFFNPLGFNTGFVSAAASWNASNWFSPAAFQFQNMFVVQRFVTAVPQPTIQNNQLIVVNNNGTAGGFGGIPQGVMPGASAAAVAGTNGLGGVGVAGVAGTTGGYPNGLGALGGYPNGVGAAGVAGGSIVGGTVSATGVATGGVPGGLGTLGGGGYYPMGGGYGNGYYGNGYPGGIGVAGGVGGYSPLGGTAAGARVGIGS